jgi:hypothetical protein
MHNCPDCGLLHEELEMDAEMGPDVGADAAVKIARIEANRDVTIAEITSGADAVALAAENAELRAALARLEAPTGPENPVTVVLAEPPAEPAAEPIVEPIVEPVIEPPEPVADAPEKDSAPGEAKPPKKKDVWWG